MKQLCMILIALAVATAAWGQNPPPNGPKGQGPGQGPGMQGPGGPPPSLVDQGFTEDESKAIQADLKQWEQANREFEADLQLIDAQRNRAMVKENLDRGELEKTFRAQYDLLLKRDLARLDLMIKWRKAYGLEKSRMLDGMLRGPQGPGPGQGPDQPNQPPKKP